MSHRIKVAAHAVVGIGIGVNGLLDVAARLRVHDMHGGAASASLMPLIIFKDVWQPATKT